MKYSCDRIIIIFLILFFSCEKNRITTISVYPKLNSQPCYFLPVKTTNIKVYKDIFYGYKPEEKRLMDLFAPIIVHKTLRPALIVLHGGGFTSGTHRTMDKIGMRYAQRGFVVFTIDYTLATKGKPAWDKNIQDVICAIRYVKENSKKFQVDPQKIVLFGFSAGGHLASLAGVLNGDEPILKSSCGKTETDISVKLVISYFGGGDNITLGQGLTNPKLYERYKEYGSMMSVMIGGNPTENPQGWVDSSPTSYLPKNPPLFIVVHGDIDKLVPPELSLSFVNYLRNKGIKAYYISLPGESHDNFDWNRFNKYPNLKAICFYEYFMKKLVF